MAKHLLIIAVVVLCLSFVAKARPKLYPVDGGMSFLPSSEDNICLTMIKSQGYVCEEHKVMTKDGYILTLQRIPVGRSGMPATKPPVLLQHGLTMDAVTWLLNSPDESLGFILADEGYDVWLANSRGTNSSFSHKSLSPSNPAYWEWSWDELAAYDLPATFQHIYDTTGQKFHYVGHSLGTLIALAVLSRNELLGMLRSTALLSPIAYVNQMPSPFAIAAADIFLADELYWLGLHEFAPKGKEVGELINDICSQPGIDCSNLMSVMTGPNCCINGSRTNIFLEHEPQPTSMKNMIHLAQMIRTGTVAMFDYGNEDDNMNHYGQTTPPVYNMTSIPNDFPMFLSYGGKDALSDVNDVKVLLNCLKDHDGDKIVVQYREDYAHADFIFGVNANEVIYNPLMAFFSLH